MATLKEILAGQEARRQSASAPTPENLPPPPKEQVLAAPRNEYLGRQDGTEPVPMDWPPDDAAFCKGNEIIVVVNPHLEGFLAVSRPGKPVIYLTGPHKVLNIPF